MQNDQHLVYSKYEKPIYLANMFNNAGVAQRNLKKSCKFEHCIDLGVLLNCKTPTGQPCVQLEREENYADQEQAKVLTVRVFKAELFEELDPNKSSFQLEAERERAALAGYAEHDVSDEKPKDPVDQLAIQLSFEFDSYAQMFRLYQLIDD